MPSAADIKYQVTSLKLSAGHYERSIAHLESLTDKVDRRETIAEQKANLARINAQIAALSPKPMPDVPAQVEPETQPAETN